MDKPQSLSMRDYLVRKLAVKLMVNEKVVDTVVAHQFSSANDALRVNDSIEISGFGKFYFNHKKAVKRMETLLSKKVFFQNVIDNPETSEQKRISAQNKWNNNEIDIETLKQRIHD